mmetsp:Transcript_3958/g.14064  ORF Transcript_3958/g.14064 Transcript_3958/m.14064 type:complete len:328 (+) Transcript_3958:281-1264(+)
MTTSGRNATPDDKHEEEGSVNNLAALSNEMLLKVLLLVDAPTLANLAATCHELHERLMDDYLWEALAKARWGCTDYFHSSSPLPSSTRTRGTKSTDKRTDPGAQSSWFALYVSMFRRNRLAAANAVEVFRKARSTNPPEITALPSSSTAAIGPAVTASVASSTTVNHPIQSATYLAELDKLLKYKSFGPKDVVEMLLTQPEAEVNVLGLHLLRQDNPDAFASLGLELLHEATTLVASRIENGSPQPRAIAGKKIRLKWWSLGSLGRGLFRCRDTVFLAVSTLEDLTFPCSEKLWETFTRGAGNEVVGMEISEVLPGKEPWWCALASR